MVKVSGYLHISSNVFFFVRGGRGGVLLHKLALFKSKMVIVINSLKVINHASHNDMFISKK